MAAFVVETVGGLIARRIEAPRGYFERLCRVCKKYRALLSLDEIICRNGRTRTYFAFKSKGAICLDIVVVGKGLFGGYQPLAVMLISRNVYEIIKRARGFIYGHTY